MKPLMSGLFALALVGLLALGATAQTPSQALDPDALLVAADVNGDGSLSRAEFVAERARNFDRLDRIKDGTLTRDEFSAAAPAGMRRTFIGAQFAVFDSNSDKRLSRAEYNGAPTPGFDRLDANHDDILSAQEMRSARGRKSP